MNNDLISRKALIEAVEDMYEYAELGEVLDVIKTAPTVEPENERALDLIDSLKDRDAINNKERGILRRAILLNENTRPQGEWIRGQDQCCNSWFCSICNTSIDKDYDIIANYCPYCGAQMRQEESE